jgi:hypothetical protein
MKFLGIQDFLYWTFEFSTLASLLPGRLPFLA